MVEGLDARPQNHICSSTGFSLLFVLPYTYRLHLCVSKTPSLRSVDYFSIKTEDIHNVYMLKYIDVLIENL
jgi:hypothetical protein